MIVEVIEVRVRSLVDDELGDVLLERRLPATGAAAPAPPGRPASGSATQPSTSRIDRPPSAAACSSAASTRRAWASQNSRSPPTRPGARLVAASMSVARSVAVTGSAQPVSGSNVIVDGEAGEPDRVEHEHRPAPRPQRAGTARSRSVRVRGDEDGAGGVEDPAGQPAGLAGARAAEHERDVLDRGPHPQQPDPAQPHRDLAGRQPTSRRHRDSLAQGGADGGGAAAHRPPAGATPDDVRGGGHAGLAAGAGAPPGHQPRRPGPPVPPQHARATAAAASSAGQDSWRHRVSAGSTASTAEPGAPARMRRAASRVGRRRGGRPGSPRSGRSPGHLVGGDVRDLRTRTALAARSARSRSRRASLSRAAAAASRAAGSAPASSRSTRPAP